MNVLSLFDGMSCGMLALKRANIPVDNYFASEIDKYGIKVSQSNFPEITHLGDVTKINSSSLPKIDLLIGGSPCQSFSLAGKQLNFEDRRGQLFLEYTRILRDLKPKFFLLENVMMKIEYQKIISEYLGVEPIKINSSLVSAQNRKRLYWTNIPNVTQPENKGVVIKDILNSMADETLIINNPEYFVVLPKDKISTDTSKPIFLGGITKYKLRGLDITKSGSFSQGERVYSINGKACTLSAQSGGSTGVGNCLISDGLTNSYRKLEIIEAERLQTLPDHYTAGVSNNQRFKMIGNGWTVDVIAHIFNAMKAEMVGSV
jgi:DNA-cytosine methyltransferase